MSRIPFQDTDEVRDRTQYRLATAGNEIFVLEVNGEVLATRVIETSIVTSPRAKPPVTRRSTSTIFPSNNTLPLRGDERWDRVLDARRASSTTAPMARACVTV